MNKVYEIPASKVIYNNHDFESQLEAQWAVFFDDVGIKNIPHPGTFRTGKIWQGKEITYSPDFYLPDFNDYCEVKATDAQIQNCDIQRKISAAMENESTPVAKGLLILGPMINFHRNEYQKFCLSGEYYRWCGAIAKSYWKIGNSQDGEIGTTIIHEEPDYENDQNFSHYPFLPNPSIVLEKSVQDRLASEQVYKAIFNAMYASENNFFIYKANDENDMSKND